MTAYLHATMHPNMKTGNGSDGHYGVRESDEIIFVKWVMTLGLRHIHTPAPSHTTERNWSRALLTFGEQSVGIDQENAFRFLY